MDFAYAVHTDVGHRTIGARVNGKLVPLHTELKQGDIVEISTSKAEGAGPSRDWQSFVKSPRAKAKIRGYFSKERREESIEKGKEALTNELRRNKMPLQKLMTHELLSTVAAELHHVDISALYQSVGDGHTSAQNVIEHLTALVGPPSQEQVDEEIDIQPVITIPRSGSETGVIVEGVGDVLVKLARCCTPVPPDDVKGFVTRGQGISVHRTDCLNLAQLEDQQDRIVQVAWADKHTGVFLVEIQVEALDRKSLLSDVTRVLAESHVNILSASVQTSKERVAMSRFSFEMGDPSFLDHVLNQVRRIDGVYDVYRTTAGSRR